MPTRTIYGKVSIIRCSGHAMSWSSITGNNVPPHIESRIDM